MRSVIDATGVLKDKTRRALDSTLLDDAVATQDTVTQLISAIRRVRRVVPGADRVPVSAHDYESSGKPLIAWDDPVAKAALVDGLVRDALALLEGLDGRQSDPEGASALGLLALVAGQDVEQDEDGTWRIAQRVAPDRMISTVDPEARHMRKSRSEYRDGYKAHIAIEPETGLVTKAILTKANVVDGRCAVALVADEDPGLMVLGDTGYASGETLAALEAAQHQTAIKPWPLHTTVPGGFDRDDFVVDHDAGTATCPAGHTVKVTPGLNAIFKPHCGGCTLRERCTTAQQGRSLVLTAHDKELVERRASWRRGEGKEDYRRFRPMVERAIAWLVADAHRRVRFRGVERNHLGLSLRIAALNLRRLINLGLAHDGAWTLSTT